MGSYIIGGTWWGLWLDVMIEWLSDILDTL